MRKRVAMLGRQAVRVRRQAVRVRGALREQAALAGKLRDAGWPLSAALAGALLVQALIPAGSAVTMALLVGVLERRGASPGLFGRAVLPLAAFAVVLLAGHVIDAADGPLEYAVRTRIDGVHRAAVARLAASAPMLTVLERPRVRDLIRLACADPDNWTEYTPGQGAVAVLTVGIGYAGVASSCAVLAAFAPWLVPVILVPAWAGRVLHRRRMQGHIRLWTAGIPDGRQCEYWKGVATSAAEGKELRVFGFGPWAIGRSQRHLHAMFDRVWARQLTATTQGPLIQLAVCGLPLAVAYGLVAAGTAGGRHSVAAETAVLGAGYSVCVAAGTIFSLLAVEGALPSVRALDELRAALAGAAPAAATSRDEAPAEVEAPQLVLCAGVCFSYPGSERAVLRDLDLEIRPGELLAIVGLNGAGKSTLIKLLAGLYRPSGGSITAGGTDIFADLAEWRRRLSVVFQDFGRYELSVRENITLSAADQSVLDSVARVAGLDEVLAELPAGWDTPLARSRSGGVDLSGGRTGSCCSTGGGSPKPARTRNS